MGDKVQRRRHGRGGEKAFFPCELKRVGLAYAPRQRKSPKTTTKPETYPDPARSFETSLGVGFSRCFVP